MRLSNLRENQETIDEAPGGWVDQKVLSKFGTQASKKTADTRIQDRKKGEELYSKWLEVSGGGSEYSAAEVASWLLKNVKIAGMKVDQNIAKKSFQEVNIPFPAAPRQRKPKTTTGAPPSNPAPTPAPQPAANPAPTVNVPDDSASEGDWQNWASNLAQNNPRLYAQLAKAVGAKISTPKRKRSST